MKLGKVERESVALLLESIANEILSDAKAIESKESTEAIHISPDDIFNSKVFAFIEEYPMKNIVKKRKEEITNEVFLCPEAVNEERKELVLDESK